MKTIALSMSILTALSINATVQADDEPQTRIKNMGGKCLDVSGSDRGKNGAKVHIWACNQASSQQWWLDQAGRIHNQNGKCLDVNGPDLNKNAGKVQLWDCNDAPNQQWRFDKRLRLHNAGGKCLDIHGPELHKNGGKVQIWDCNDAPNQQWKKESDIAKANTRPEPSAFIAAGQTSALRIPAKNTTQAESHTTKPITPRTTPSSSLENSFAQSQQRTAQVQQQSQTNQPVIKNAPAPFSGMIKMHNEWRAKVGVKPLTWSDTVAKSAQAWADELKTQYNCRLKHNPKRQYGENLGGGSGRLTSDLIVGLWAAESTDYDYASNRCTTGKYCTHYTQMVWRKSTEMGCGEARCDHATVWVCNYNPMGNYMGQKPY